MAYEIPHDPEVNFSIGKKKNHTFSLLNILSNRVINISTQKIIPIVNRQSVQTFVMSFPICKMSITDPLLIYLFFTLKIDFRHLVTIISHRKSYLRGMTSCYECTFSSTV